jgi:hypothetical protein
VVASRGLACTLSAIPCHLCNGRFSLTIWLSGSAGINGALTFEDWLQARGVPRKFEDVARTRVFRVLPRTCTLNLTRRDV